MMLKRPLSARSSSRHKPLEIPSGTRLLIACEGRDEKEFLSYYFGTMFPHDWAGNRICIQNIGGIRELKSGVSAMTKQLEFARVQFFAIVCDSEHDPDAMEQRIRNIFSSVGLPVPTCAATWMPAPTTHPSEKHCGFLLFPACGTKSEAGTLEDFALRCLSDSDASVRLSLAENYLNSIDKSIDPETNVPKKTHRHKQRLYSYLSGFDELAGLKIGEAARANAFAFDNANCASMNRFFGEALI